VLKFTQFPVFNGSHQ